MAVGTADVQRWLWRNPFSRGVKITIGPTDGNSLGTGDAQTFIDEATAKVYAELSRVYKTPPYIGTTTTVHPLVERWIAMISAADISGMISEQTPALSGQRVEYHATLRDRVEKEIAPYLDRKHLLIGTNGALVKFSADFYPQPQEQHPSQSADIFAIKPQADTDATITREGFVQP